MIMIMKNNKYSISNYDSKRNGWLKKKSISSVFKNEFVPICRVIGSFGNYRTLFYYLMNKINSEEKYQKPNLLLKDNEKINNNALYSYFKPYLNIIQNTWQKHYICIQHFTNFSSTLLICTS